jgi:hypothetical protein
MTDLAAPAPPLEQGDIAMHRLPPVEHFGEYDLSRHASERYAVLTAVKERRALDRSSARHKPLRPR